MIWITNRRITPSRMDFTGLPEFIFYPVNAKIIYSRFTTTTNAMRHLSKRLGQRASVT